ncbi:hypothetical protein HPP92_021655 [Vanilla planifolia]|uniref:Uncharacterized protein n=1 Tax=Vanilla planifolia TaxID=51239 RepID=A0A835UHM3_VANPL|nr:hypothetical protein HPP92_021975 [Vanilla planifolia]KAG0463179.1 hypothetical protein HPP92_021655 [Vanilla planifolia]
MVTREGGVWTTTKAVPQCSSSGSREAMLPHDGAAGGALATAWEASQCVRYYASSHSSKSCRKYQSRRIALSRGDLNLRRELIEGICIWQGRFWACDYQNDTSRWQRQPVDSRHHKRWPCALPGWYHRELKLKVPGSGLFGAVDAFSARRVMARRNYRFAASVATRRGPMPSRR